MLPEIAVDVLLFLSRRDLDKTCAVSKWLDALIAQCCDVYPLRLVREVALNKRGNDFKLNVWIKKKCLLIDNTFGSMVEAARVAGSVLRHSYIDYFELSGMSLDPANWTTLINALHSGAICRLELRYVDFSVLDVDAFLLAVSCRGLLSFIVRESVVPNGLVMADLMRSSVAEGLYELMLYKNKSDAPHEIVEDAILDFFFQEDAKYEGQLFNIRLDGSVVTDIFLSKFFQRLRARPLRLSGSMLFHDAVMQRGLTPYARYLGPRGMRGRRLLREMVATYLFPSTDDENSSYEVEFCHRFSDMSVQFRRV